MSKNFLQQVIKISYSGLASNINIGRCDMIAKEDQMICACTTYNIKQNPYVLSKEVITFFTSIAYFLYS